MATSNAEDTVPAHASSHDGAIEPDYAALRATRRCVLPGSNTNRTPPTNTATGKIVRRLRMLMSSLFRPRVRLSELPDTWVWSSQKLVAHASWCPRVGVILKEHRAGTSYRDVVERTCTRGCAVCHTHLQREQQRDEQRTIEGESREVL